MSKSTRRYALVTAAYNEEAYIEQALATVAAQTVQPLRWVVVSDGSRDRTDEIVLRYSARYKFIELLRITKEHAREFAAQVHAMNIGFRQLDSHTYDYIGNLDADISLPPTYFEQLLDRFERNSDLGLAGGYINEDAGGGFRPRSTNSTHSVPLGLQLFRWECFASLGGYLPLRYGGPDWHAEVTVRRSGWRVESFPHLIAFHHRPTGTAGRLLHYCYLQGFMDYSLGSHPLFEIVKLAKRLPSRPYVLGAMARFTGFVTACLRGEPRPVSEEFVRFLREEQTSRLRLLLAPVLGIREPAR